MNLTATITNHADAYCNLAYSYVQTGNTDAALKAYAQCTNLDPNNPDTWNQIGLVYMSQDDYTDALDAFNHATQITTTNAEIGTTRVRHSQRWDATRMHWVVLTQRLRSVPRMPMR